MCLDPLFGGEPPLHDALPILTLARVLAHLHTRATPRIAPISSTSLSPVRLPTHAPHCMHLSLHTQWEDLVSEHYKAKCGGLVPEHRASIDLTHRGLPTPSESIAHSRLT